jgi:hypothetical protein
VNVPPRLDLSHHQLTAGWPDVRRIRTPQSQSLERQQHKVGRVEKQVPPPQAPGFLHRSVQPLKASPLHQSRGLPKQAPKDLQAFERLSDSLGYDFPLLREVAR